MKIDCSINEACLQAGVPSRTVYTYIKEDALFADKVNKAKDFAVNLARKTLVKGMQEDDVVTARWLLSKRRKDIYGDSLDLTSKGESLNTIPELIKKANEIKAKRGGTAKDSKAT